MSWSLQQRTQGSDRIQQKGHQHRAVLSKLPKIMFLRLEKPELQHGARLLTTLP